MFELKQTRQTCQVYSHFPFLFVVTSCAAGEICNDMLQGFWRLLLWLHQEKE